MTAFAILGGGIVLASLTFVTVAGAGACVVAAVMKFGFPDRLALPTWNRPRLPKLPPAKRQGRHVYRPQRKGLDRLARYR